MEAIFKFCREGKDAIGVMDKHLKMALGNIEFEDTIRRSFSQRLYEFGYFYVKKGGLLRFVAINNKIFNGVFL